MSQADKGGWNDAAREQPTHGRKVFALQPRENEGYIPEAGYSGTACAWVIARWEAQHTRWGIMDSSGNWHAPERISWWRELPKLPDGVLIVPPDRTE
jgi:hypothetical protein